MHRHVYAFHLWFHGLELPFFTSILHKREIYSTPVQLTCHLAFSLTFPSSHTYFCSGALPFTGHLQRRTSNKKTATKVNQMLTATNDSQVEPPEPAGNPRSSATVLVEDVPSVAGATNAPAASAPVLNTNTTIKKFSCLQSLHFDALMSAAVVEFIGTFLLVLTVPLSVLQNAEMAPISIGFLLMSLVFSFGYLSGGHVNPMVTISVWMATSNGEGGVAFTKRRLIMYVVAQMAGGVAAAFYCMMINGREFPVPNMGRSFNRMLRGFLVESVFTFVLCSVVLHVAISQQRNNNFYGFAIGFSVLCGGLACGPISGGVFNPAVATPLIVVRCLFSFNESACTPMASLWVYWASEAVGAVCASIMYLALHNLGDEV
ncbi:aquaporin, putative [Leishmania tarentolae]|uniref:Aquaporin, putative n=1 Tax=Leishmania tarentolae TaxID=5689 RepID=A0A640KFW8_LEITA|nr:aquaporin, putative [Leishmania tarentolae]